nr:EAL domain-containing protein [Polymorphobacter sp.]
MAAVIGRAFGRFVGSSDIRPDAAERLRRRRARSHARLLRGELDCALKNGEIYLVYQPKLCLRRGVYDGVEALIRWQHPNLGEIDRGSVITIVEDSGQIHALTLWVLGQAIIDQRHLLKHGIDLRFHVNLSGKSLGNDAFIAEVSAVVKTASGIIGFEITETAFIDHPKAALLNFNRLAADGVRLSIDDYGSGHSSLAYLKELPADELKIDKLFVSGMTRSNRDPLIVRSTIDLAHALGMRVVAEGVESHATLALLRVMGCDVAQGYFISPALRLAQLEIFLRDAAHLARLTNTDTSLTPAKAFWVRSERDRVPGAAADGAAAKD